MYYVNSVEVSGLIDWLIDWFLNDEEPHRMVKKCTCVFIWDLNIEENE